MNNLCLSLLVLAALLVPACTQLSNVRMFMKDSDLNKRFRGTEHVFKSHVRVVWDGVLPSSDILSSAEEGKPLPPLPANMDTFLFTVTVLDAVDYIYRIEEISSDGPKLHKAALSIPGMGTFTEQESSFTVILECKEEVSGIAELSLAWRLIYGAENVTFSFTLQKACSGPATVTEDTAISLEAITTPSSSSLPEEPLTSVPDEPTPTFTLVPTSKLETEESSSIAEVAMSESESPSTDYPTPSFAEVVSSSLSVLEPLLPSSSAVAGQDVRTSSTFQDRSMLFSASSEELLPKATSEVQLPPSPSYAKSTSLSSTLPSLTLMLPSLVPSPSLASTSHLPSFSPSPSVLPSSSPSVLPSSSPSVLPSSSPSVLPSSSPSVLPSSSPSVLPSSSLSILPSSSLSILPSSSPSVLPSSSPSVLPSSSPPVLLSPSSLSVSPSPPSSPSPSPPPSIGVPFGPNHPHFYIIVGSAAGGGLLIILLVLIICVCCCCCCCCYRKKKRKEKWSRAVKPGKLGKPVSRTAEFISPLTPPSLWTALPWGNPRSLPEPVNRIIMDYGRSRGSVTIHNTLKTGTYGCILRGRLLDDKLNPESPANLHLRVKMLAGFTSEGANRKEEVRKFLETATLMKGLDHNNILPLVGVCAEEGYVPLVLYPYCEQGSVHSFLEKYKYSPETVLTIQYQLTLCLQIAEGMLFLSENSIVHPDLALRNCFMDSNFTVKIGDSALTGDLYPDFYHAVYGVRRPVRWAAIETLTQGICEVKSNVWSFAITAVEVFTLAELPYPSVKNKNILAHVLLGNRPARPSSCPPEIHSLLQECWYEMTHYRPGFREIVERLHIFCKDFVAKEKAEVDGLLEDLEAHALPYMSPAREKKVMLSPSNTALGDSASTICDGDVQTDPDEVFHVTDGIPLSDINVPNGKMPSRPSSAASRERHPTVTSTFSQGEKPSPLAVAQLRDSRPSSALSREGSFRRTSSPAPSPRTPVPVRPPVPPIAVRSETATSHSTTSESTDASAASQRPLVGDTSGKEGSAPEANHATQPHQGLVKKPSASEREHNGCRSSDPFSEVKLSIGTDLEDDFMATFDSMLSTSAS